MGGSSGTRSAGPAPQQAQPINYGSLMQAASKAAMDQERMKYKLMIENYPAMETLSLGTVDRIAGRLGATPQPIYDMVAKKDRRGNVIGYERKQVGMSEGNAQTAEGLAAVRNALSLYDAKKADPTSIEQKLYNDAETELGLGRSLSAEDERAAQQSARSAGHVADGVERTSKISAVGINFGLMVQRRHVVASERGVGIQIAVEQLGIAAERGTNGAKAAVVKRHR